VIPLPFECRGEYPLLFKATCPKCRRTDVYHAVEVREHDPEKCEEARRKAEELVAPIYRSLVFGPVYGVGQAIVDVIKKLEKTLEKAKEGEGGCPRSQ
jgi:hypothetical protein